MLERAITRGYRAFTGTTTSFTGGRKPATSQGVRLALADGLDTAQLDEFLAGVAERCEGPPKIIADQRRTQ